MAVLPLAAAAISAVFPSCSVTPHRIKALTLVQLALPGYKTADRFLQVGVGSCRNQRLYCIRALEYSRRHKRCGATLFTARKACKLTRWHPARACNRPNLVL
jgi:hypothetical protein